MLGIKCSTKSCRNKAATGRKICIKCKNIKNKETNPVKYYFSRLKSNAKRRRKEFLLTIEEFKDFCTKTNYLELKGRFADSIHIDRKIEEEGYHKGNIRVLSNSDNVSKKNEYYRCKKAGIPFKWVEGKVFTPKYSSNENSSDYVPF